MYFSLFFPKLTGFRESGALRTASQSGGGAGAAGARARDTFWPCALRWSGTGADAADQVGHCTRRESA
jgi:hypothetical protein